MTIQRYLLTLAAGIALVSAQPKDPEAALGAARHLEEAEGNYTAAIEAYKKILAQNGGNRGISAKALLRLGACYEKLGNSESRKAYERVVREFSDQKEAVTAARERLGNGGTQSARGVVVRQVWTGDDVDLSGSPSPDGRYLVYVDWKNAANLAIRDLKSGESRFLTKESGKSEKVTEAYDPLWSPDGKQVAYQWYENDRTSLRVVSADGSRTRVLSEAPRNSPVAWSPDGKWIASIEHGTDRTRTIALTSTVNGSITRLKSTAWRWPSIGGFSPDGKLLVYSLPHSKPELSDGGIFTIAIDGSAETRLVEDPSLSDGSKPVWTPDGRAVLFTSNRSGSKGLWSISVMDGKPQGSPEMLRPNIGDVRIIGLSTNGTLFYGTYNRQVDVHTVELDPRTLTPLAQPNRLTERLVGSNWGPAWSPDGKSVAFFRRAADADATRSIVIRSILTGKERTLPVQIRQGGYVPGYLSPHWFPDGRSLLALDATDSRWTFKRIDLETGDSKVVIEGMRISPHVQLAPDGRTLYYSIRNERASGASFGVVQLMKRNLATGEDTELYRSESPGVSFFGLAISRDGAYLSFSRNLPESGKRALTVVPTAGGAPREIYHGTYEKPTPFFGVWSKDGTHILFASHGEKKGELWAIPAEGGEPKKLGLGMEQISFGDLSPDGGKLAFTSTRRKGELWAIDNLIPEIQAALIK